MRRLEGKTAIVTGAASGIGAATAKRFASEGAQVMVADMNGDGAHRVAAEITAAGGEAVAQIMDLNDEASLKAMVEAVLKKFGKLEILHNNAADMRPAYLDHDRDIESMDTRQFGTGYSTPICAARCWRPNSPCRLCWRRKKARSSIPAPAPRSLAISTAPPMHRRKPRSTRSAFMSQPSTARRACAAMLFRRELS